MTGESMTGEEMTDAADRPLICVMGVSAAGKSTVGVGIAVTLGIPFLDADDLHSEANRAKMASGVPLTDDDRRPWLDAVGAEFASAENGLVIACSALRRDYRDRIRAAAPEVRFVHVDGSPELLASRAAARADHFMPPALLASQLATLEPLADDEVGIRVDVAAPAHVVVQTALSALSDPAHGDPRRKVAV